MRGFLRKLRNAARISPGEWRLFFKAWFWLLVFDLGLRTRPFPTLQALASGPVAPAPKQAESIIITTLIAVDRARNNHLYPMTCLRRALTLQKLLNSQEIATELKIGVHREADQLTAHAWVEYQGKPLGETEQTLKHYVTMIKN